MSATTKSAKRTKKIDFSNYINPATGETLLSEFPNLLSVNTFSTDSMVVDYTRYTVNDYDSFTYLGINFTRAERDRITEMGFMAKGRFRILYIDDKLPHTKSTLMKSIDYTYSKFNDFIKKLEKFNIIVFIEETKNKKTTEYILFNPYISKNNKIIDRQCSELFNKFKYETSKLS